MDSSRVSFGERVAAASAVALVVAMFLPWYEQTAPALPQAGGMDLNAWQAFGLIDVILLLVAATVIALAALRAAGALPELPAPPATIVLGAGLLAVVLIAIRIVAPPEDEVAQLVIELDVARRIGVFLGLVAAAGIAYGGYRQTQESAGAPATPAEPPPPSAEPLPPPAEPPPGSSS